MAAGTASLPPKIADPATRTLAPAATLPAQPNIVDWNVIPRLVEGQDVQLLHRDPERHHELPLFELAVATDQIARRTVMAELGLGLCLPARG
jgi:hypothetical protein